MYRKLAFVELRAEAAPVTTETGQLAIQMTKTENDVLTYHHTQKGPWSLLLYAMAVAFVTARWYMQPVPGLGITFLVTGLFMFLLAVSCHHLAVADEGNQLVIRFGPFPLFSRRIRYDEIREVETGRTRFLDGWGIHWIPWGGWVWNIWGRDCVVIRLKKGVLRVGTDDPKGLAEFLKARIAKKAER